MSEHRTLVPDLVGFGWDEASRISRAAGLRARAVGPDDQPVRGRGGVVIAQRPAGDTVVDHGSELILRIAHGGGSGGDREPLEPPPSPSGYTDQLDEPGGWVEQTRDRTVGSEREPALVGT